ncbi:hypothetical protein OH77DRAFT_1419860 [Trametes cingulata]|nr:hypothetical protein OH77DRAFT_1419860 [Trametes cingulata]
MSRASPLSLDSRIYVSDTASGTGLSHGYILTACARTSESSRIPQRTSPHASAREICMKLQPPDREGQLIRTVRPSYRCEALAC